MFAIFPARASAEVGTVASVYSDYRFRGLTLSDGRPVGILDLSYDSPGGIYGALSASAVATRRDGLRPLGLTFNAGYAARIGPSLTADLGVVRSRYSHYSEVATGRSYTEFYAGLSGKFVGARLSISPGYVGTGRWTLRGEANGHADVGRGLTVDGVVGALVPIGGAYAGSRPQWDARLGISRRLGAIALHAAVTGRIGGENVYLGRMHSRVALVFGISTAL